MVKAPAVFVIFIFVKYLVDILTGPSGVVPREAAAALHDRPAACETADTEPEELV